MRHGASSTERKTLGEIRQETTSLYNHSNCNIPYAGGHTREPPEAQGSYSSSPAWEPPEQSSIPYPQRASEWAEEPPWGQLAQQASVRMLSESTVTPVSSYWPYVWEELSPSAKLNYHSVLIPKRTGERTTVKSSTIERSCATDRENYMKKNDLIISFLSS